MIYYRALGLVASASLVVAGIITFCLFVILGRTLGFTLTLAGVAGAIVAIGITADSFIVYFERLRDESRDGKTLRVAAETGWTLDQFLASLCRKAGLPREALKWPDSRLWVFTAEVFAGEAP